MSLIVQVGGSALEVLRYCHYETGTVEISNTMHLKTHFNIRVGVAIFDSNTGNSAIQYQT